MALDFIQFINNNVSLSAEKKQAMLDDFCEHFDYESGSKKDFANNAIENLILTRVNSLRKNKARALATFEELVLN